MASNKSGLRQAGKAPDKDLAGALLAVIAAGVAGGIMLVAGAKALGEKIEEKLVSDYKKKEEEREADKEAVREASANDLEFGQDPDDCVDTAE
jgi:hypothetical protein